jgi:hypothetical protein
MLPGAPQISDGLAIFAKQGLRGHSEAMILQKPENLR